MKEVAIITTYQRDELLYLCLEAIRAQRASMPIAVFSDRNATSPDLVKTCEDFNALLWVRPSHAYYGNSWNLLTACQQTVQHNVDIVHIIEDDTLVKAEYFNWADLALSAVEEVPSGIRGKYAVACGRSAAPHLPNNYDAPCASWNVNHLRIALETVQPEYFAKTREEMQRVLDTQMFPESRFKKGGAEQDGFFVRCMEYHKWKTIFPPRPLAVHLGWWGYNRETHTGPQGTFRERIAACRAMLKNREERVRLFGKQITDAEWGPV